MILSIATFGGNKDNYYNFKGRFLGACENLRLANLYLNHGNTPGDLEDLISDTKNKFDKIEFED